MRTRTTVVAIVAAVALCGPLSAFAKGASSYSGPSSASPHSRAAPAVPRDAQGEIERSAKAKSEFKKAQPCPSTGKASGSCPGYVIDHVVPLKRGGADGPSNMQWQTIEEAKRKDRWE